MKKIIFSSILIFAASYAINSNGQSQQPSLLHVEGKALKDDCGETIILKGVNMGSIYDAADFGTVETDEVASTGANSMRMVLESNYCTFPPPNYTCVNHPTTSAQIQPMIQACLDKKIIPILELHDYTGTADPATSLTAAANWWTKPDIKNLLLANQNYLIINLANEPSSSNYPPSAAEQLNYFNANVAAIKILRNEGYTCPIMIDGMHFGLDHLFFVNHGEQLMAEDPLHKLLFSVHAYWPSTGIYVTLTDAQITNNMTAMSNVNAPFVLGEIAHSAEQNGNYVPINYQLLLSLCAQKNIGYLVWWWGIENATNNPLAMSNGTVSTLTTIGNIFAFSDPNSLFTSVRPFKFVNGQCNSVSTHDIKDNENKVFPVPTDGKLYFNFNERITFIAFLDLSGRTLIHKKPESYSSEIDISAYPPAIYFVKITTEDGKVMIKKVVKN